jgi:hypothetical protein
MSTYRKFHLFVILALISILLQSFTAHAYSVQSADFDWFTNHIENSDCDQVLQNAEATIIRIDVPTTYAEYMAMDRIAECQVMVSLSSTIPVTGRIASDDQGAGYFNKDFIEFKYSQAEERMGR